MALVILLIQSLFALRQHLRAALRIRYNQSVLERFLDAWRRVNAAARHDRVRPVRYGRAGTAARRRAHRRFPAGHLTSSGGALLPLSQGRQSLIAQAPRP